MTTMETPAADGPPDDGMLPRDTSQSLPIALLRAREALMSRFRPILAVHETTEQQWRVLRMLAERSPLDASELAERACVLAPSLTRIVKNLQDRRLITRTRDNRDGRRVMLSIAPAGLAFIREVSPESRAVYKQVEERYGAERVAKLVEMLNELATLKQ